MMNYDPTKLRDELVRDEAIRLKPYVDFVQKITIGVGRNLSNRGISRDEAFMLLANDIRICESDLDRNIPWWHALNDARARAVLNMTFNLGWTKFSEFRALLVALEAGDYDQAAHEALASTWANQVGARARRIAMMIREG